MAMVRATHWWDPDQLHQAGVIARKRGISRSQYLREALLLQLGRDSARDEIAELRDRVTALSGELEAARNEIAILRRRISQPR